MGDARSKSEIAGGDMSDGKTMFRAQGENVFVYPDAMRRPEARPKHTEVVEIADRGSAIDLSSDDGLQPGLCDMHVDRELMTVRDIHAIPQEALGTVMRNRGGDSNSHAIGQIRPIGHDLFNGRNGPLSPCRCKIASLSA